MRKDAPRDRQAIYRDWLLDALKRTGKKPTPFAREAGLSHMLVSRAIEGKTRISAEKIDELAAYWKLPLPVIGESNGRAMGMHESEVVAIGGDTADRKRKSTNETVWSVKSRALELIGYMPGDFVVVDPDAARRPGDVVLVQIVDLMRGSAETVLRLFESPHFVVTKTLDPSIASKPYIIDDERVSVAGVVVRSFRERN